MHEKMIVGYIKGPFHVPGPAMFVYEINNRFYIKGNYAPAIRINRETIDTIIRDGNYISEPRELHLNTGLKAFALDEDTVFVGFRDELVRKIYQVSSN